MSVQVQGIPRLRAALLRLPIEGTKAVRREVMRSILNIQKGAKTRVAVDTGRLRNSIATETENGGLTGIVGTNVLYARPQEFGTWKMPAHPFLFPSYEEEWPHFVARLRKALGDDFVKDVRRG